VNYFTLTFVTRPDDSKEATALVQLTINGQTHQIDVDPEMPLLWAIRDHVALTGTKYGCGIAQCGACTVHLDGQPVRSCQTRVADVGSAAITTIEGVNGRVAEAVQAAWRRLDVVQCGYCQSGQIMSAIGLLSQNPAPTDADIDGAMDGNICRCGTYQRIRAAIHDAARALA
jgi:isoquinoline 1-oxidoreductase alpha subunit